MHRMNLNLGFKGLGTGTAATPLGVGSSVKGGHRCHGIPPPSRAGETILRIKVRSRCKFSTSIVDFE
jgi:hypothetical protein